MHSTKNNLQVLYQDNHLIIVNKRPGDISQGDKTGDKPLSDVVKEYLKEKYNNARHPIAFSEISNIYNHYDGKLSQKQILSILNKKAIYQLKMLKHCIRSQE